MFVFLREYYVARDQPPRTRVIDQRNRTKGSKVADLDGHLERWRQGERSLRNVVRSIGAVHLQFDAALTRFSDLAFMADKT
jgi:hypothetical protein